MAAGLAIAGFAIGPRISPMVAKTTTRERMVDSNFTISR
jgi:hypothetical protein